MIGKAIVASVLGFVASACLLALGLWFLPQHGQAVLVPALVLFFPLWLGLIAVSFQCKHALSAGVRLGALDIVLYAGLQAAHRGWLG